MPNTIPMYVFTGFLESGKTKFIQETLEDERFNAGEKTLLLVFEEGEEEYDISTYPSQNVYIETMDYEGLSEEKLEALRKKHHAERVIVELNGMHLAADFYLKTPDTWQIAQEVMFADANTFLSYNQNMRQLTVDKLAGAERGSLRAKWATGQAKFTALDMRSIRSPTRARCSLKNTRIIWQRSRALPTILSCWRRSRRSARSFCRKSAGATTTSVRTSICTRDLCTICLASRRRSSRRCSPRLVSPAGAPTG